MTNPLAVIDLGTNTFQLIIAEALAGRAFRILHQQSMPSRIGKGGINNGLLTDDAMARGIGILNDYKHDLQQWGVASSEVAVFGTSAIRNAANRDAFIEQVASGPGFKVQVIDGDAEAGFIYEGVRQAVQLDTTPHLIMDIGGGSVEFIIANHQTVFWKKSFEIGGQRLMEKFVKSDPISSTAIRQINAFLDEQLMPLSNAVHQYAPKTLVGSSGSFETLAEMEFWRTNATWPPVDQAGFDLSMDELMRSSDLLVSSPRTERLALPGMRELRVDLIIVAIPMIHYVIKTCRIEAVKASRYSLKEGVLSTLIG